MKIAVEAIRASIEVHPPGQIDPQCSSPCRSPRPYGRHPALLMLPRLQCVKVSDISVVYAVASRVQIHVAMNMFVTISPNQNLARGSVYRNWITNSASGYAHAMILDRIIPQGSYRKGQRYSQIMLWAPQRCKRWYMDLIYVQDLGAGRPKVAKVW